MSTVAPPEYLAPVKVLDSVADAPYLILVRFIRFVGLFHLGTLGLLAILVWLFLTPFFSTVLSSIPTEVPYLLTAFTLLLLLVLRGANIWLQLAVFTVFLIVFAAAFSLYGSSMHDRFPAYAEGLLLALLSACLGLLVYLIVSGRDLSLPGAYYCVWPVILLVTVLWTIFTDMSWAEGITVMVLMSVALFYWVYDLAMILQRRKASENIAAVIDLYRDCLNILALPGRFLRVNRRWRRVPA